LILFNRFINWWLLKLGRPKYSLSKKIKNSVKKAVSFITDFEETAAQLACENGFDYVGCGHIHQPQIRDFYHKKQSCLYLNSGDWIENLTALEYQAGNWSLMVYEEQDFNTIPTQDDLPEIAQMDALLSNFVFNNHQK